MKQLQMNHLWVRFSLIISGFFFILILLPLGTLFILEQTNVVSITNDDPGDDGISLEDLPEGLAGITLFVSIAGIGLGIWLSRGLSSPIVELAAAAKRIGEGDLSQRVPVNQHSLELDDLAQSFNRMAADLEHGEALRNSMLADISHELRTPLTVLSGQLRASLDKVYQLDEEEVAHLYGQTEHLIRLVEDLRLLAQAEANQLPLTITDTDLAAIWQELNANFRLLAEEKQVSFTVDLPAGLPKIPADPGRLRQIFSNLLANALRHTPSEGSVDVKGWKDGDFITISITDSGEGIVPDQLSYLFDRFYRADASRTRNTGGSGLGLAIAQAMVKAHQGEIRADSAGVNQGSTFTVQLPLTRRTTV